MNVLTVFSAMLPYVRGRALYELFPDEFMTNLPYDRVSPGCCILCLRHMRNDEMFPPDRITPRAICPTCWAPLTANVTQICWICLDSLESWRVKKQERHGGDLHFRIHEGKCRDYFSLVSAKALGQQTGIIEAPSQAGFQHPIPRLVHPGRLMIPKATLRTGGHETHGFPDMLELPSPIDLFRFQNPMGRTPDFVPARPRMQTYNGKKVKVIPRN